MHTHLLLGGLNLLPNFQKGDLGRTSIFREWLLGKRGVTFSKGGREGLKTFASVITKNLFFGPGREPFSNSTLAVDNILYCFKSEGCRELHHVSTYFNTMFNNSSLITCIWLTNAILLLLLGIF